MFGSSEGSSSPGIASGTTGASMGSSSSTFGSRITGSSGGGSSGNSSSGATTCAVITTGSSSSKRFHGIAASAMTTAKCSAIEMPKAGERCNQSCTVSAKVSSRSHGEGWVRSTRAWTDSLRVCIPSIGFRLDCVRCGGASHSVGCWGRRQRKPSAREQRRGPLPVQYELEIGSESDVFEDVRDHLAVAFESVASCVPMTLVDRSDVAGGVGAADVCDRRHEQRRISASATSPKRLPRLTRREPRARP